MNEIEIRKAIRGDAKCRLKGYLYQFMIALDRCFDLGEGESLFIETYGDLAILKNGEDDKEKMDISIEVKMYNENNELDMKHPNFLNTLYNWSEDRFDFKRYKDLILFTTQRIKESDLLYGWNSKTSEERYNIVQNVYKEYITKNELYINDNTIRIHKYIEDNVNKMKKILSTPGLQDLLSRIQIIEKQDNYLDFYENTLLGKRAYMQDKDKSSIFINSLLGIILNPLLVDSMWEISYVNFRKELDILVNSLAGEKRIFPTIEVPDDISIDDNALFLQKLREIEYDKIEEAICHFAKVSKYIEEETTVVAVNTSFNNYKNDLLDKYEDLYNIYSSKEIKDLKKESISFMHTVFERSSSIKFSIYDRIEPYFRKGLYHNLANEQSNNIKWLLK